MSKYIVELFDGVQVLTGVGASPSGTVWSKSYDVDELEELNSDYINEHYGELQDEAYQRGHDDGYEAGCATAFKPVSDAEYQRGLEDAWEAARKIIRMPDGDILDLFPDCYASVCTAVQAILKYDASEAIAKLKAYEHKDSDSIEVGDEVRAEEGHVFVVTGITDKGSIYGFDKDGMWLVRVKDRLRKTGKHYDIQSILEAMRE